jgi:hypothetical protein
LYFNLELNADKSEKLEMYHETKMEEKKMQVLATEEHGHIKSQTEIDQIKVKMEKEPPTAATEVFNNESAGDEGGNEHFAHANRSYAKVDAKKEQKLTEQLKTKEEYRDVLYRIQLDKAGCAKHHFNFICSTTRRTEPYSFDKIPKGQWSLVSAQCISVYHKDCVS